MLAAFASAVPSSSAHAEKMRIAERLVDVKLPSGFCAAREKGPEATFVDQIRNASSPHNRLVVMFLPCDELKDGRVDSYAANGGPQEYGSVLLLTPHGKPQAPESRTRSSYLAAALAETGTAPDALEPYVRMAEKRLQETGPGDLGNLGIIGKDENALYMGMLYTARDAKGNAEKKYVAVGGLTLVKGLKMTMNTVRTYKSPTDLPATLAAAKAALAGFVAAND